MYWLDALWKVADQGFSIGRICSISVVNQIPKLNLLPFSVYMPKCKLGTRASSVHSTDGVCQPWTSIDGKKSDRVFLFVFSCHC